jgi:hypothetical protein
MSDENLWMDRDDALAYIMRYPVVMLEETSGIPVDGDLSEIYRNAMSVGVRNNRNIKKGLDVNYDGFFTWHEANYGFITKGDALIPYEKAYLGGKTYDTTPCNTYNSKYVDPEQDAVDEAISFPTAKANGPKDFYELGIFWYNYQKQYIEQKQPDPLFIRLKLDSKNTLHIKEDGYLPRHPFLNEKNPGYGIVELIYKFKIIFSLKNYISVGDILSKTESLSSYVSVLFAHKSICSATDVGNLYTQLSYSESPVYVLRTALFKISSSQKVMGGIDYTFWITGAKNHYDSNYNPIKTNEYMRENVYCKRKDCWLNMKFAKTYSKSVFANVSNVIINTDIGNTNYLLLTNPKSIFDDILSGFMNYQGDITNLTWKGLIDLDDSENGNRYKFISALCKQSPNIPAYPYLCACLGNGNEVASFKIANSNFSMFCHSQKCFDGYPGTFKYIPSTPQKCATIMMCDQRLEGNVFKFVKIDTSKCDQTINTTNLEPVKSNALTKKSYNVFYFTLIVLCAVFAFIVLILQVNKNTV